VRQNWLVLVGILSALAVYAQAAYFEFVYDDLSQIVQNPQIKSWSASLTYFRTHAWGHTHGLALYYRPVYMLWLTANYKLFGLNPFYWHVAVIALHIVCCVLVFLFVRRLTANQGIATGATLLFALHPAHVESVAWVSGATDPLLTALFLGAVLCYAKYLDFKAGAGAWYLGSLILAALAVLTKETAVITPAIIFAYRWNFPRQGEASAARFSAAFYSASPYALISLCFWLARSAVLAGFPQLPPAPIRSSFAAWPEILNFYEAHLVIPFNLSVFYNLFTVTQLSFRSFFLPLALAMAIAAGLYYAARRSRMWAFLAAWICIMFVPVLGITLWNNVENVHDRYLYLPSIAVCVVIAAGLWKLNRINQAVAVFSLVTTGAVYAVVTNSELAYWQDEHTLAERGIAVSPGNALAAQVEGNWLVRENRTAEAIPYFVDALSAQPNNLVSLSSLAYCYVDRRAFALAEEMINRGLRVDRDEPRVHLVLGILRMRQQRLDEAEAEIEHGLDLERVPNGAIMYHYYLGDVLTAKGDLQAALREYRLEARNDPEVDPSAIAARERIVQVQKAQFLQAR
jgi:tetratricopeptide (TPR) repeat protein